MCASVDRFNSVCVYSGYDGIRQIGPEPHSRSLAASETVVSFQLQFSSQQISFNSLRDSEQFRQFSSGRLSSVSTVQNGSIQSDFLNMSDDFEDVITPLEADPYGTNLHFRRSRRREIDQLGQQSGSLTRLKSGRI